MKFVSAAHLTGGGTITGDLTISGDLTVSGDSSGNYSEIITGNLVLSTGSKIAIGTGDTSPAHELIVHNSTGGANSAIQITNDDSGGFGAANGTILDQMAGGVNFTLFNQENGYMRFGTNNAESFRISGGANGLISG